MTLDGLEPVGDLDRPFPFLTGLITPFTLLLGVDNEADDDLFFSPSLDHTA